MGWDKGCDGCWDGMEWGGMWGWDRTGLGCWMGWSGRRPPSPLSPQPPRDAMNWEKTLSTFIPAAPRDGMEWEETLITFIPQGCPATCQAPSCHSPVFLSPALSKGMDPEGRGLWLRQGCAGKIKGHRIIESWNGLGWKGTLKVSYSSPPCSAPCWCLGRFSGVGNPLRAQFPALFREINVFHSPGVSSAEIWAVPLHAPPDLPLPQQSLGGTIPGLETKQLPGHPCPPHSQPGTKVISPLSSTPFTPDHQSALQEC